MFIEAHDDGARGQDGCGGGWRQARIAAVICVVGLASSLPARAQDAAPARDNTRQLDLKWQWSTTFENDVFYGQDSGYSTGLRTVFSRNESPDPDPERARAASPSDLKLLRQFFPNALSQDFVSSTSRGVGFSIFTPQDNDAPDDERPYGGYLYGLYNVQRFFAEEDKPDRQDSFFLSTDHYEDIELQLGWLGPHSYVEHVQTGFHEIWPRGGNTDPWPGRQIEDSPAVNLFYTRVWSGYPFPGRIRLSRDYARQEKERQAAVTSPERRADSRAAPRTAAGQLQARKLIQQGEGENEKWRRYWDFRPFAGFATGNVYDYASTGISTRLGFNIPTTTIGPPLIRPGPPGSDMFEPQPWSKPAIYLFGGLEGRFVLYDAFLDGNIRDDSPNVDKKYFVGDYQYGLAAEWNLLRLAYNRVTRSAQYDGQGTTSFGSINLTLRCPF